MKILKYEIGGDSDYQYFVESAFLELVGEEFAKNNIHQTDDDVFFLVADETTHRKFKDIIFEDVLVESFKEIGVSAGAKITDMTTDILENIHMFENLPNNNKYNGGLVSFFYGLTDKDDVLDKISKYGIQSLNGHDKSILDA